MNTVHIHVGTDDYQRRYGGEKLFAAAVQDTISGPYKIHWMRATDASKQLIKNGPYMTTRDGAGGSWRTGCDYGDVYPRGGGWGTPFTHFRWSIPEMRAFEGHAIYTDCDQLFLKDPRILWEAGKASPKPVYLSQGKACVMVLNNEAFKSIPGWPSIDEQKQGSGTMYELRAKLDKLGLIDKSMSRRWNDPDKVEDETALVHYTNARTQPWHPYQHKFGTPRHPNRRAVDEYRRVALLAMELEDAGELLMDGRDF